MTTGAHVFALCRTGFEREAVVDLERAAATARASVGLEAMPGEAFVSGAASALDAVTWRAAVASRPPIFARNACVGLAPLTIVGGRGPRPDRIAPLLDAVDRLASLRAHAPPWRTVWVEFPDTNEGKQRTALARALEARLDQALRAARRLDDEAPTRLHVLLPDATRALVGTSDAATTRWPLGIPRIRVARGAPSRSAAKLAEAFVVFLGHGEAAMLHAGQRAVDLGAAPGGWSWLVAQRGLRVIAVDNGPLKGEAAREPLITHVRADGLAWRPRRPVDWLFCDIVEQPIRIADVVGGWIADGMARHAIFNLKLPMKRRYDEVLRCEACIGSRLAASGVRAMLELRQLYHDREEVTGFVSTG